MSSSRMARVIIEYVSLQGMLINLEWTPNFKIWQLGLEVLKAHNLFKIFSIELQVAYDTNSTIFILNT